MNEQIRQLGACVAFTETIPKNHAPGKISQIVEIIKASSAKVVVVFSVEQDALAVFQEVLRQNLTGVQWIGSEAWVTAALLSSPEYLQILGGSVGFAIRRADIPGLKEFLLKLNPSSASENPFILEFWEKNFGCSFQKRDNHTSESKPLCTGHEDLAARENIYSDVTQLRVSYNVYKSVYALAHSLHNMRACENGNGPFANTTCPNISSIEPWQVWKCSTPTEL